MIAPVSDEELVAFLHGALEPERAAQVEAALDADPELADRAEALDRQDDLVRQAFAPILAAPIPSAMREAIVPADTQTSNVISLDQVRNARARNWRDSWSWPQFGAMAASLAVGIIAGPAVFGDGPDSQSLVVANADGLSVPPALSGMLDSAASGETVELAGLGEAKVDLSFRNLDQDLCRQVQFSQRATTHDLLACRSTGGWAVEALGSRAANVGEMRTAGGDAAPAVVAAVDAMIDGDPLVGADERAALRR